jgi:hypothetical protein
MEMNQVPADRVIALLTQQLADMHRENAILKVQVSMLEEQANAPVPVASLPPFPLPPVPSDTPEAPAQ